MKRVRPRLISIITTDNKSSQEHKGSGDNRYVTGNGVDRLRNFNS